MCGPDQFRCPTAALLPLRPQAAPLADLLAFNTVKRKLGGKVRLILSGAAPLSKPVQRVLSCCMCAPVLQGYGLTETCAASTIAEPYKWDTIGTVGGPMPGEWWSCQPTAHSTGSQQAVNRAGATSKSCCGVDRLPPGCSPVATRAAGGAVAERLRPAVAVVRCCCCAICRRGDPAGGSARHGV